MAKIKIPVAQVALKKDITSIQNQISDVDYKTTEHINKGSVHVTQEEKQLYANKADYKWVQDTFNYYDPIISQNGSNIHSVHLRVENLENISHDFRGRITQNEGHTANLIKERDNYVPRIIQSEGHIQNLIKWNEELEERKVEILYSANAPMVQKGKLWLKPI